ncbi:MAG TPA: S8 family serine peptidase [Vicinamibacterales bacterium]
MSGLRRTSRTALWITVLAAAALIGSARGRGQTSGALRQVLDNFAPPAIERGISPLMTQAPDSPDVIRRRSIRRASAVADRIGASGAPYVAGKVIVKFRESASTRTRTDSLREATRAGSIDTRPAYANFDIVRIDPGEDAEAVARTLSQRPDVEYAQPAYRVHAQATTFVPNDRFYPEQWNLPMIDMERAWAIQPQAGSSITVAVLDTGVAFANKTIKFHANAFRVDADGNVLPANAGGTLYPSLGDLTLSFVMATELGPSTRFVAPHDFVWNDDTPLDFDGHGTHVSGTIGQMTNNGSSGGDQANGGGTAGVAFNVKLMPVKVLASEWDVIFGAASETGGSDDVVAQGIRYAADNGAKIINMSLGASGPAGSAPVIEDAIKYAVGKGAFIALAGGNDFEDGNPTEVLAEIASRVPGAVSVAAVDKNKAHAFYSSTGPWIELAAPGGSFRGFDATGGILQQTLDLDLVDTFDAPPEQFSAPRFDSLAYFYFTGTSQATPHVSGVAAMLMQQGITNPGAIEAALERFALDLGSPGRDNTFGFGLVQARDALRGLGLVR